LNEEGLAWVSSTCARDEQHENEDVTENRRAIELTSGTHKSLMQKKTETEIWPAASSLMSEKTESFGANTKSAKRSLGHARAPPSKPRTRTGAAGAAKIGAGGRKMSAQK
jgi:hypothetical protein